MNIGQDSQSSKHLDVEQIKSELDALCSSIAPSKVVLDINDYAHRHVQLVLKEYGRFVAQFELYFDSIVELIHGLNYIDKSSWPIHRSVQFLLIAHNLKPLYSSFDRLHRGFYEDSLTLLRPVYEAFIKIIYISCYPNEPYSVVTSPKRTGKGRALNFTNFIGQELKLGWSDYNILSSLAHSNYYLVLHEVVEIHKYGQKEAIGLKFKFDKQLFELGANQIIFMYYALLKIIVELMITSTNKVITTDRLDKSKRLVELAELAIATNKKPYWPKVVSDTRDIFQLISRIEGGESLKQAWGDIRKRQQAL